MELGQNATLLLGGGVFGFLVALAGGWVDYRLRFKQPDNAAGQPALLLSVAGLLAFLGLVAVAVSLLATGGIMPAVVCGVGVGIGFNLGFVLLVALYLISRRS